MIKWESKIAKKNPIFWKVESKFYNFGKKSTANLQQVEGFYHRAYLLSWYTTHPHPHTYCWRSSRTNMIWWSSCRHNYRNEECCEVINVGVVLMRVIWCNKLMQDLWVAAMVCSPIPYPCSANHAQIPSYDIWRCCMGLSWSSTGIILSMRPANGRQRWIVTLSFFGWVPIQNDPFVNKIYRQHHVIFMDRRKQG